MYPHDDFVRYQSTKFWSLLSPLTLFLPPVGPRTTVASRLIIPVSQNQLLRLLMYSQYQGLLMYCRCCACLVLQSFLFPCLAFIYFTPIRLPVCCQPTSLKIENQCNLWEKALLNRRDLFKHLFEVSREMWSKFRKLVSLCCSPSLGSIWAY